jgi:hypothetical protein
VHIADVNTLSQLIRTRIAEVLRAGFAEHTPASWPDLASAKREVADSLAQGGISRVALGEVGEFAIGTNYGLDRFCHDFLLDEKIGGTVHIALGRAYPACGGDNMSAIHWDLIKDTRREGAIYLDGEKVFENGVFMI